MGSSASRRKQEELSAAIQNGWAKGVREILAEVSAARSSQAKPDNKEQQALREVDLNAPLPQGYTPLQLAALKGCTEVVRLLLEFDQDLLTVNPNAVGSQKRTALHFAAAGRKVRCVSELLAHGADPCIAAADDGKTPLDIARANACPRCVQAIEGTVVLWQGWVDHYEQKMLVIPSWRAKWLVILRDRRPNTGLPGRRIASSRPCSHCAAVQPLPKLVSRFPCQRCGTEIPVPASLQLALYELAPGASDDDDVDVSVGSVFAQALPQDPSLIVMTDTLTAFQSTVSSKRQNAASVKVLDSSHRSQADLAFRFSCKLERLRFFEILKDPQRASLESEAEAEAKAGLNNEVCWGQEEEALTLPEPSAPPQSFLMSDVYVPGVSVLSEPAAPPSPVEGESGVCVRCSVFPCGGPAKAGPEVLVKPPRSKATATLAPMEEEDTIALTDRSRLERSLTSPLPAASGTEAATDQALRPTDARAVAPATPARTPVPSTSGTKAPSGGAWTPPPVSLAAPTPPSAYGGGSSSRGGRGQALETTPGLAASPAQESGKPPGATQSAPVQKLADACRTQEATRAVTPTREVSESRGAEGSSHGRPTPPRCRTPPPASAPPTFPESVPPSTARRPPEPPCLGEWSLRPEASASLPQLQAANADLQSSANGSTAPAAGAPSQKPPQPPPQRRPSTAARPAPAPPPAAPLPWN